MTLTFAKEEVKGYLFEAQFIMSKMWENLVGNDYIEIVFSSFNILFCCIKLNKCLCRSTWTNKYKVEKQIKLQNSMFGMSTFSLHF